MQIQYNIGEKVCKRDPVNQFMQRVGLEPLEIEKSWKLKQISPCN